MTKASDNAFPSILITEGTEPSAPAAGKQRLYIDSTTHLLKLTNSSGTDSNVGAAASTLAGYEYDYVQKTTNTSITATVEASSTTHITGAGVAYDGSTIILIEFYAYSVTRGTGVIAIVLFDGSTAIGHLGIPTVTVTGMPFNGSRRLTPSAATHTYSIRAYVDAGTGTISAGAAGVGDYMPSYMRITRV